MTPLRYAAMRGVSMVEMAVVLTVSGVMLGLVMAGRAGGGSAPASDAAAQDAVVSAVYAYAKRNFRLPCPDSDGDDLEDRDASTGQCTASDLHTGGVPYKTLGLTYSSSQADSVGTRLVYGVYRGAGALPTDLTQSGARSVPNSGASGVPDYTGLDALRQAVRNAAALPVGASQIYVAGDDAATGPANCSNVVTNLAFAVVYAGPGNADRSGGDFDGAHLTAGWSAGTPHWNGVRTSTCFIGPGKQVSATYDDVVRAVSFPEFLGALSQ